MSHSVKSKRKRRSPEALRKIVSQFDHSQLSRSAFCRKHGLSPVTFARWYGIRPDGEAGSARRPESDAVEFIQLDAVGVQELESMKLPPPAARAWDIELQIGAGMVLRLRRPC